MRKYIKKMTCAAVMFLMTTLAGAGFYSSVGFALEQSQALKATDVEVINNAGKADTIDVYNLSPGDVVYAYKTAKGGKPVSQRSVPMDSEETTLTAAQLGSAGGVIYISVKSVGMAESERTTVPFAQEPKTDALDADNVSVTNNAAKADIIYINDLSVGDFIRVYKTVAGKTLVGSGKVGGGKADLSITVQQVGTGVGSLYLTNTSIGARESARIKVDYEAEAKSQALDPDTIMITNNASKADTIYFGSVEPGDTLKVYSGLAGGKLLGSTTVPASKYEAQMSIQQVGAVAGSVYISVTSEGKIQSSKIKVDYFAENKTSVLSAAQVTVTNNAGKVDNIRVTGLSETDLIKVYDTDKGVVPIATGTVATSASEVNISVRQLGSTSGDVYLTLTSTNKLESPKTKIGFAGESRSVAPIASLIETVNLAGVQDTIKVNGLLASDTIKIYDAADGGKLIGSGVVSATGTQASVTINQLGSGAGDIYVTVTTSGLAESERVKASFLAEAKSNLLEATDITIQNNAGIPDKVTVVNLSPQDTVKVYSAATGDTTLGTVSVAADGIDAAVAVRQLSVNSGSVYVSIKRFGKLESERLKADYIAEPAQLSATKITVENNVLISDTVKVTGLNYNDMIKVYDAVSGGNLLGFAKVPTSSTEANVAVTLSAGIGSVYVAAIYNGMGESLRVKVDYSAEQYSIPIYLGNVEITNNKGSDDIIKVYSLTENDVVKVYDSDKGGSLIATARVSANTTQVTMTAKQLGTSSGAVYMTVTSVGKNESIRVKVNYIAE